MNHNLRLLICIFSLLTIFLSCSKTPTENEDDQIIPDPLYNTIDTEPNWSPDGNIVAYTHLPQDSLEELNGPYQIWILYLDNMEKEYIAVGYLPEWSPDGKKIVYVNNDNIYIINLENSFISPLTNQGENYFPSWSPDGKKIAFDSNYNNPHGFNVIWIMNADGTEKKNIFDLDSTGGYREPHWSPNGYELLCRGGVKDSFPEYFIMDTSGSNVTRITQNDFNDRDADWSHNGKYIAWGSYKGSDGRSGIWKMNADGSDPVQLTQWGGYPSWSPDDTQIVYYQSYDDSTGTLWIMKSDGSNQRLLTTP